MDQGSSAQRVPEGQPFVVSPTEGTQQSYTATQGYPPPHSSVSQATSGLSDTAAGALAYVTIIPAIVFLVLAPYNTRPFVKFHAIQCLGLTVAWFVLGLVGVIPVLGWIVLAVGGLALLVVWILCIVKASQGSHLELPVISKFAREQSGYSVRL